MRLVWWRGRSARAEAVSNERVEEARERNLAQPLAGLNPGRVKPAAGTKWKMSKGAEAEEAIGRTEHCLVVSQRCIKMDGHGKREVLGQRATTAAGRKH